MGGLTGTSPTCGSSWNLACLPLSRSGTRMRTLSPAGGKNDYRAPPWNSRRTTERSKMRLANPDLDSVSHDVPFGYDTIAPRPAFLHPPRRPGMPHYERPTSRRDFLARAGGGLGLVALAALAEDTHANTPPNTLDARKPHFEATAKSVIWVFLDGGPSHVDLFDPKPTLTKLHGKPLPGSFTRPVTAMGRTA